MLKAYADTFQIKCAGFDGIINLNFFTEYLHQGGGAARQIPLPSVLWITYNVTAYMFI